MRAMGVIYAMRPGPIYRQCSKTESSAVEPIARVRVVNVDTQPALRERYNDVVPVMALHGAELPLAMGRRTIDRFLDTGSWRRLA